MLGETLVKILLHTCELHEVDVSGTLQYPLLSDSHSPEANTSSFEIP